MSFGCVSIPAISHADDIALLAPTISSLKLLLNIVKSFGNGYSVKINPDKSKLLVFRKSYNDNLNITFNGCNVSCVSHTDNLGYIVGPDTGNQDIDQMCKDFVMRVNFLFSNFNRCSYDVKYGLVQSYCMAFYGYVLLDLTSKNINKVYVRKCICKFVGIHYQTHSKYVSLIFVNIHIEAQLHKIYVKFLSNILHSENHVVQLCGTLMVRGSQSAVSKSFYYLVHHYSLPDSQICDCENVAKKIKIISNTCAEKEIENIEHIKNLVYLRDIRYFDYPPCHLQ